LPILFNEDGRGREAPQGRKFFEKGHFLSKNAIFPSFFTKIGQISENFSYFSTILIKFLKIWHLYGRMVYMAFYMAKSKKYGICHIYVTTNSGNCK
jgi:hypothetical protein